MTSAEQLEQKMQELWRRYRSASLARLEVVERAVEALNKGVLTDQLRIQAAHEAHKLAGSLGTFGMRTGSTAALEIESFFSSYDSSVQKGTTEINDRVDRLKQEIEGR
jgi:HPt (histidine-containing phosphotransfer) domain-containing protein